MAEVLTANTFDRTISDVDARLASELQPLFRFLDRSSGFALAFVRCNVPVEAKRVAHLIVASLVQRGREARAIELGKDSQDVLAELEALSPPPRDRESLLVLGLGKSSLKLAQTRRTMALLNQNREHFRRLPGPLVLILPDFSLTLLAQEAPDFWAWRSSVVELTLDRIRLESLMQEYTNADPYGDLSPARKREHLEVLLGLLEELDEQSSTERLDLLKQAGALSGSIGDRDAAFGYATEAVEIARSISTQEQLAAHLVNLSNAASEVGNRDEGIEVAGEAARIYRRLAKNTPQRFEPELAMSLNNWAIGLADNGEAEAALETSHQAVEIYWRLAKDNSQRFEPGLALSLHNWANRLDDQGDSEAALAASEEAVALIAPYAERYPGSRCDSWRTIMLETLQERRSSIAAD